ncbi:MAG: hypothetical protein M1158_02450 [Candidatus Marsarchaeota archaeon]|nr:hypothetical protein [Candidatus Marsarchaeota archaeon]
MSESAVLRRISGDFRIPLSTLKLNMEALFERGFVARRRIGEPLTITHAGRSALNYNAKVME